MIPLINSKTSVCLAVLFGWAVLSAATACGRSDGGSGNGSGLAGLQWIPATASGTYPEEIAFESAAAFDSQRNRTVIAWGNTGSSFIDEVWGLTVSENQKVVWGKLLPSGKEFPQPRAGHSAVYDSGVKRLLFFGGYTADGSVGEVWEIGFQNGPGGVWRKLSPAGDEPGPRRGHTAIFDDLNNRMLIFGGGNGAGVFFPDLWELRFDDSGDGTWTKLGSEVAPASRAEHSAVLDPGRSRMILFGGMGESGEMNDTWELNWSGGTPLWKEVAAENAPPPRSGHTAVLDPIGDRMIVFGGAGGGGKLNDVWALDLSYVDMAAWQEIVAGETEIPEGREQHIALRDGSQKGFRMIVYGGFADLPGSVWLVQNQD